MKKILMVFLFGCKVLNEPFGLNEETYVMWRDYIQPTEQDLAWSCIPWRSSFQEGLIEAAAKQKPMLLWAMNGHPLGCT